MPRAAERKQEKSSRKKKPEAAKSKNSNGTSGALDEVALKYQLYEHSVQSPDTDVELFERIYREVSRSKAQVLREDFCGTHRIATEWVRSSKSREALALDIDPEPLTIGKQRNLIELEEAELKRIDVKRQNVLTPTKTKTDLIVACNFSFYIFKEREELLRYFLAAKQSLKKKGLLILEMVGGPGFEDAPFKEKRSYKHERGKKRGKRWFSYEWEQRSFDPIHREGEYAINFKLTGGKELKNAFVYDWRVWTVPEVSDCLRDVGLSKQAVYWTDYDDDGDPTDEYRQTVTAENDDTWICYLVAAKN